jgi:hypothetical protein
MVRYRSMDRFSKICTFKIKIGLAASFAAMSIVALVEGDFFYFNWSA